MAHKLSPAAKKEAMRAVPEEDPEFQIAPMIDILLVLLVFFMSIASTEVLQTNDAVKLPVAKDSKESNKGASEGQTIINVLWNGLSNAGSVDLDGKVFAAPSDVVPELQKRITANPAMRVLVRADKDVRYEYTRQLLQAVGTAGVGNVTFSVVNKESAPPPNATASAQ
jgi:biopolymer transport protein ExbD